MLSLGRQALVRFGATLLVGPSLFVSHEKKKRPTTTHTHTLTHKQPIVVVLSLSLSLTQSSCGVNRLIDL